VELDTLGDWLRHRLIGTAAERPLRWVRALPERVDRRFHPEWNAVRDESQRIERILERVVRSDSNCIDVGCHLGSVLNRLCRLAPAGRHMAFEPTPYKAERLARRYPDVEVRQEALSDTPGEAEFFHKRRLSGFSGLRPHGAGPTEVLRVRCARLDDLVPEDRQIGFVKIDVEGAEPLVLRGARGLLSRWHPHVLFECTLSGLALYDTPPGDVHRLLTEELGYSVFLLKDWLECGPALPAEGFVASMRYPAQAFNYMASAPGSPPCRDGTRAPLDS
jgi:FkbM family methyltransferase